MNIEKQDQKQDTFQFFIKSADKPPGFGVGEFVNGDVDYNELSKIKNWRRMFSDLYIGSTSIKYKNLSFKTQHHAFQAAKFLSAGLYETAFKFSIESCDKIGLGNGVDAFRARKLVMLTSEQLENWNKIRGEMKDEIYLCKYTQVLECNRALLETKNALLISGGPRIKKIICKRLMETRDKLRDKNN